uniref:Uncharacterized protein n=1 Tax=Arundo donax TaxID=35708 RepID=A0A0A9FQQ4_ARUDO
MSYSVFRSCQAKLHQTKFVVFYSSLSEQAKLRWQQVIMEAHELQNQKRQQVEPCANFSPDFQMHLFHWIVRINRSQLDTA